jgi:peroxiredoxin
MKRIHTSYTVALAGALLAASLPATRAATQETVRVAQPAPRFQLKDANGREVKLSDFDGKAVIVTMLLSADRPSQKQIAVLVELRKKYDDKELAVVAISLDSTPAAQLQEFAKKHEIAFPILLGDYKIVQDFGGFNAVPTTFVIDKNHNIIHRYVGVTEEPVFEDDLCAILKK